MPSVSSSLGDLGEAEDDADRTGDGVAARHDAVGGDCGDVAARGRDRIHDCHHGLVLGQILRICFVERLGAGRGAAGAVDPQDDALDAVATRAIFVEKVEGLLVAGDQSVDAHAGDMVLEAPRPPAGQASAAIATTASSTAAMRQRVRRRFSRRRSTMSSASEINAGSGTAC